MSQGVSCKCPEAKKRVKERRWFVLQRQCNYSAFSGYHYTPSDYSCVQCHACGMAWRTKASYVDNLKDGGNVFNLPPEQWPSGHLPTAQTLPSETQRPPASPPADLCS